ncbi:MAG: succinate dehydrogenase [Candidatus Eisenbacteria bacterium]|uniref:Succinate dehydrogenase n=1 Tax=Eiseniibacteriota bacterium TaxID=2212470 RepID=A0A849SSI4_UNCEI|nr:succinate dehydrogenase [Candidatus Eisenbacteria bacterium]
MRVSDSTYYTLKRLHSLSGVVPIGAFLLEHFLTNSRALQGAAAFDRAAAELAGLPYVVLLEAGGIWMPILFHMVLGILIATTSQANLDRHGYARNWHYSLQRFSGLFLVLYLVYHTWSTRFSAEAMSAPSLFAYMREHLSHPGVFAFYVLGVIAACYHFGNGLFGFAIHWGLVTSRSAQRWAGRAAMAVVVVLSLVGINALLAFTGHGLNLFQKHAPPPADVTVMNASEHR